MRTGISGFLALMVLAVLIVQLSCEGETVTDDRRPNILIAISDDQSYPHTSAYGYPAVRTPAFDRVAGNGVLFTNAFTPSPGCSPSRAAFLTGRHPWQLEQAGTHAGEFPAKYPVFPELLEEAGYFVGYTGKGWGPGNWEVSGRTRNPAGVQFSEREREPPHEGIHRTDYAANFADFLRARPDSQPFCFWFGSHEPHRVYEKGVGLGVGKRPADAAVPPFLPDTKEVRSDILDYTVEIEWFDTQLSKLLQTLEEEGELENTLVIVTSDNGMPFPRAKANLYEYGFHVPLAVSWPVRVPGGRVVDDLIGFVDLTATILEAAALTQSDDYPLSGSSILEILTSDSEGTVNPRRDAVFAARERHSSSRFDNLGYPQRCIRTPEFLYIRNFAPDRWPAGDPQKYEESGELGPMHDAYHDIDRSPTLSFLVENREDPGVGRFFHLAVDRRPAEELFDIKDDPGCLKNLAGDSRFEEVRREMSQRLEAEMRRTRDPRAADQGEIWENYKRYSAIRSFPEPVD